ncbi:endo alpha-1,4 polygalactosaminidase [Benzoatithermus flavus]|uniref:Endo alpha-1,4 polygalactosaminidase n=1 Tax=Benzoatithermus flavus TaxID=3108223 RepID=A0ABU8XX89_9PROT
MSLRLIPDRAVRRLAAMVLLAFSCAAPLLSAAAAEAPWRPDPGQRVDLQLLPPFDLARRSDVLVLDLFQTPADRVHQLEARGVAAVCWMSAGSWEGWRPDAYAFPQTALGRNRPGRPGERWLDPSHPAVLPLLEHRLDLCRERGFKGVLLAGLDGYARPGAGFPLTAEQQLTFAKRLADAARTRGLAAGITSDPEQAATFAPAFDFLVAADCIALASCVEAARPYRAAGKPVWLVAYTNIASRMAALCAAATRAEIPLLFKTRTLTGRLHRRCPA